RLARALSVYMMGVTFGSGLAYMVGGSVIAAVQQMDTLTLPVIGAMEGWQLTFFLVGLPGVLVALLMTATVREPVRRGVGASGPAIPLAEAARYVWDRRAAYGAHIVGISVFVMVVYALNLWGPTYFIRTFGYTSPKAGWTFGSIMIGAGTAGLLVAGAVADRWMRHGVADAYLRTILLSMLAMWPCVVALGFLPSDGLAIVGMSL